MEANWDRTEGYRVLTNGQIDEYLSRAGMRAVASELIAEGKANTNYRVSLEGGETVLLRLHTREPAAAPLEAAVAERLHLDVPVPRFFSQSKDPCFSVLEWMPGRTMERLLTDGESDQVESAAEDLGRALANISRHRFEQAGFLSSDLTVSSAWPSTLDGLFGYLEFLLSQELVRERAGTDLVEGTRNLLRDVRPHMEVAVGPPCLVHGDFKASNLLIDEGRLSAVLDWEFAHSGTDLMSMGQLFRDRDALPAGFREGFERGYIDAGGSLADNWPRFARVIDLLSMFDFLNRPGTKEPMIGDVGRIIARTISDECG